MNTIMRVAFNSYNVEFSIENPIVLPLEGEIITFEWDHFLEDSEELRRIKEYEANHIFLVNILSRRFQKDQVIVLVVLFEEAEYYEMISRKDSLV